MCSVTEATDRDRSAHVAEGLALHTTQSGEEFLGVLGEGARGSAEASVLLLMGLWKAHSSLSPAEIL